MNTVSWRFSTWVGLVGGLAAWYVVLAFVLPSVASFEANSERLLTYSVDRALADGVWAHGGFMSIPEEHALDQWRGEYYSQFGLHYQLYALAAQTAPGAQQGFYGLARLFVAVLLALVLVWFVRAIDRQFGAAAGRTVYVLLLASYPLALFATKVYWLTFLTLLPFVFTFACYGRLRRGRLLPFYAAVTALVCVKSMCGYEYLTCITLSVVVGVVYHEMVAGSRWRMIAVSGTTAFLAACAGFALAFAATFGQALSYLGTTDLAWEAITRSARLRTGGDMLGQPVSLWSDVRTFAEYFFSQGQGFLFAAAIGGYWVVRQRYPQWSKGAAGMAWLWLVTVVTSFVASVSWNIATPGHMRYHLHLNFLCFYVPFNLFAFALLGALVQQIFALPHSNDAPKKRVAEDELVS